MALQLMYMLLSVYCVLLVLVVTVFLFCYWFRLVFFNGFVVVFLSVRECGPIFLVLVLLLFLSMLLVPYHWSLSCGNGLNVIWFFSWECILFLRSFMAACLCFGGWHELYVIVSVALVS